MLRLHLHLTLDDVARAVGVGRQAIYKYEQGTVTNIPLENLEKLADVLCTTPEYLACWTDSVFDAHVFTDDEARLVAVYRGLSPRGKELFRERLEELKLLYGKKSEDRSAESI